MQLLTVLFGWFRQLISGEPHFIIGGRDRPYMLRWYLVPRNRWLNLYLHKFVRDDDDRALHDHPWWFVSIMLRGQYNEILENGHAGNVRSAPSIAFRKAEHRHRVVLERKRNEDGMVEIADDGSEKIVPCWTLVLTGAKVREWGFWCPRGFVPWQEFCARDDKGSVGRGCGE